MFTGLGVLHFIRKHRHGVSYHDLSLTYGCESAHWHIKRLLEKGLIKEEGDPKRHHIKIFKAGKRKGGEKHGRE